MNKSVCDSFSEGGMNPSGQAMSDFPDSMQERKHCASVLSTQDLENITGAGSTEVNNLFREKERLQAAYSRPGNSKSEADRILKKYNEAIQKLHDLGELKSL